jgi:hypothetical protein
MALIMNDLLLSPRKDLLANAGAGEDLPSSPAGAEPCDRRTSGIWHDPQGRFMTCDAPVLVPFRRSVRPSLMSVPYIIWPVSPHRAVALSNNSKGEKAVMREASGKLVGMVRQGVEQGREVCTGYDGPHTEHARSCRPNRHRPQHALAVRPGANAPEHAGPGA